MKIQNKHLILLVICAALLGGAVPVFGKIALSEIPPFNFTFLRFIIATLVLLPFYLKVRQPIGRDIWKIIGLSFLAMGNVVFFSFGIKQTSAGITQAIYTISPILSAIFAYFILKESFNLKKIIGIIVGLVGAMLIVFLPLLENGSSSEASLVGNILIVLATTMVTLHTIFSKPFQRKYHPVEITTFFAITTVIVLFFFSIFELQSNINWWHNVSSMGIFGLIYVGSIGTALYYLLIQYIVKYATPVVASMTLYIQPFAAIFWAYLFLKETISLLFVVGILFALGGVWLTLNSRKSIS